MKFFSPYYLEGEERGENNIEMTIPAQSDRTNEKNTTGSSETEDTDREKFEAERKRMRNEFTRLMRERYFNLFFNTLFPSTSHP